MAVCALVGVLLLVSGASTLTGPTSPAGSANRARAQEAGGATAAPGPQGSPTAPSTADPPTEARAGTPATSPTTETAVDGVIVPDTGPRSYRTADVSAPTTATSGRLYRVDVRVEQGVALDPDTVARAIARTLDDPRSWRSAGRVRFSVVPAGERADLHAYVVTPGTTDRLCYPLLTRGEVSCQAGDKVVLNAKRWVLGADAYGSADDALADYREYLVNHEFGHALGRQHVGCPGRGEPAPVMLQQTKGLQGCRANPWPSRTKG